MSNLCIVCNLTDEGEVVALREKGSKSINEQSNLRGENKEITIGQVVNQKCHKDYCRNKKECCIVAIEDTSSTQNGDIDLKEICFFCGTPAKLSDAKKRGYDVYQVRRPNFQSTLTSIIGSRSGGWVEQIKPRIKNINLIQAEAKYHQTCNVNFRTGKEIPLAHGGKRTKREGRPIDQYKNGALAKVIKYMESHEGESMFMSDLTSIMERECEESAAAFTNQYLKKKLLEHFGSEITIVSKIGCSDLVLFRHALDDLLNSLYEEKKNKDNVTERTRSIQRVANLIKSDVSKMPCNKSVYPTAEELSNIEWHKSFLPDSVVLLLDNMFSEKDHELKMVSIGQAIVQAIRPRSLIAPIQFGLGVQAHHYLGSKFLIDCLDKLGFCISYTEVRNFEICAASTVKNKYIEPNQIIRFVADNVDHDSRTIDGKNTLHGMGIIAAFTPGRINTEAVVRAKKTIEDARSIGAIEIKHYNAALKIDKNLRFDELPSLLCKDNHYNTDLLIKVTWPLRYERPLWSGTMQTIHHGAHPGKSSITFLPIIDLNPSDPTCINSTLHYVAKEAKIYNVTPVLYFDEPLFWKSYVLIRNEPENSRLKSIVLMLGGFHLQMNFLGAIGYLMTGTGLQEVLELVYAPNSVPHILSGKAVARAVRAHFLVDTVLNALLSTAVEDSTANSTEWDSMLDNAAELYDKLLSLNISSDDLVSNELLLLIKKKIEGVKSRLSSESRTAKIWLQYMFMIDLLKDFLRAERTGNFKLQLHTIKKMLPFFGACGHNLYLKCAYIYLQTMARLEQDHPDVYEQFCNGNHVIRRSNRYWCGESCDLTIEQSLNRSVKSRAGLTRGRGVSENQRLIWIQSMPECSQINIAMQKLTSQYYETSEQHKDCSDARSKRDDSDLQILYDFLQDKNPFKLENKALRNIGNGMEASVKVNADSAQELGSKIILQMTGQQVSEYTFKKVNKAVTMSDKNTLVIDGEVTHIDPQLLFQRLVLVARKLDDQDFEKIFSYELCQRPSSIFDEYGELREAKTDSFGNEILKLVKSKTDDAGEMIHAFYEIYISGDWFLNAISWKINESFSTICSKYASFVQSFNNPVIIFDATTSDSTILFAKTKVFKGLTVRLHLTCYSTPRKRTFWPTNITDKALLQCLENFCKTAESELYTYPKQI